MTMAVPDLVFSCFQDHVYTAIGAAILLLLSYYFFFKRWSIEDHKNPPRAAGAWPVVGHLHLMGGSRPPHRILGEMADKYGPIFTMKLGLSSALVISNREMAKECFTANDYAVSSRPKLLASKHLGYNHAMFGFAPYGQFWREMRKMTISEILSNRQLELIKHLRISEIELFLRELHRNWTEEKTSSGEVSVDLDQWFGDLVLNVVLKVLAGKRYFGKMADGQEEESRNCQKVVRDFFYLAGRFVVADVIPYLGWFDFGGYEKAMKKMAKEMDDMVSIWLEEHKSKIASGKVEENERDYMYAMLAALNGRDLGGFNADTLVKANTLSLLAAASESSTVTLTWTISLLLNNPEAFVKVKKEIDDLVGKERTVRESDIEKLVYLQAAVKETLRLYPPGPLLTPRMFTDDCIVGGYLVRKGTRLLPNVWKIQTDPKVWHDPFKFEPERFLEAQKGIDVRGMNYELIPFGSGRRICPGITFGLQTVHFTLARFLQAFEVKNISDETVDMTEKFGLSNRKQLPLRVLIKPRLPSDLMI